MTVQEISTGEELKELCDTIKQDRLVVVDFHAEWCGPCKQLSPIIERLGESSKGSYDVYKIDVDNDAFREFVTEHSVMSIPTVIFFKKGKVVDQFVGIREEGIIKEMISKHA